MSLAIREPDHRDVPRLHALIQAHAAFERSSASLTIAELETLVLAPCKPISFRVADMQDDLLGYAAVTFDWSVWRARRYAHLDCLFVVEAERGRGIGRYLLAAARAIASAEAVDRLEWQTPAWNGAASRFYVREGAACQPKSRFSLTLPPTNPLATDTTS